MNFKKIILFISFFMSFNSFAKVSKVTLCDDESGWPPFLFYEVRQGVKTKRPVGYMAELTDKIMRQNYIDFKIKLLPWKRCLENVKTYSEGISVLLELTKTKEREETFSFTSTPVYSTHSAVFYSKKTHSKGLNIKDLADLKKLKGCGLAGYNYSIYGFKEGELDLGSRTFEQVAEKLKYNRCDFFCEQFEIISGFERVGETKIISDKEIGFEMLKMIPETPFYMAVTKSKKFKESDELLKILNKTLESFEKDGTLRDLRKKWIKG